MRIVGVIDLRHGQAVHARGGVRAQYRPVASAGAVRVDGEPDVLARYYREVYGLEDVYVADLDAIDGGALQHSALAKVRAAGSRTWVDAGSATPDAVTTVRRVGASLVVIGLETLMSAAALESISASNPPGALAVSLDVRDGRPLARAGSDFERSRIEDVATRAWQAGIRTMVVLDVGRVGAGTGPAFETLARVREAVPEASVFAGGGVASLDDLQRLHVMGAAGALVATALIERHISPEALHPILLR